LIHLKWNPCSSHADVVIELNHASRQAQLKLVEQRPSRTDLLANPFGYEFNLLLL
jgi:hypothetical protein